MDVAATADKAMARRLRLTRLAGTRPLPLPSDAEIARDLAEHERYSIHDEPFSDALLAEGEHQDWVAESGQLDTYDPDDRDDLPSGYCPRWWGVGL